MGCVRIVARAYGMFVSLLIRKAESAGGQVVELNTQKLKIWDNQHKPPQLSSSWAAAKPLLRRAGLCVEQSGSGERLRSPTVAFKPLPSDRIARRRRLVRGHAGDVVAAKREPRNPSQSAFRTPWL